MHILEFTAFFKVSIFFFSHSVKSQHNHHKHEIGSQLREWKSPIEIEVRNIHKNCQFQGCCAYSPAGCENTPSEYKCKRILMIQKYSPPCEIQTGDTDRNSVVDLCSRLKHLHIFTLVLTLNIPVVQKTNRRVKYKSAGLSFDLAGISSSDLSKKTTRMKCNLEPFIAVSFSDNENAEVTPTDFEAIGRGDAGAKLGDIFYVCATEQPFVSAWIKPLNPPKRTNPSCFDIEKLPAFFDVYAIFNGAAPAVNKNPDENVEMLQLIETRPFPPMAPSILWSKITEKFHQFAMGCKFILSDLDKDLKFAVNGTEFKMPVFEHKFIKLTSGFAYVRDGIIEDVIFGNESKKARAIAKTLDDDAAIEVSRGVENWNDEIMDYPVETVELAEEDELAKELNKEIPKLYKRCESRKALCFFRKDERDCIVRKQCHFLGLIEFLKQDDYKTMRIQLMVQKLKLKGVSDHLKPQIWGAIAFSNDTKMGHDLVFACYAVGVETNAKVFLNTDQNSVDADESRSTLRMKLNGDPKINVGDEIVMCSMDVDTSEPAEFLSFDLSDRWATADDDSTWAQLSFDFQKHNFYVLIAQGSKIYRHRISYHTHAGVAEQMFSKQLFLDGLKGNAAFSKTDNLFCIFMFSFVIFHNKLKEVIIKVYEDRSDISDPS